MQNIRLTLEYDGTNYQGFEKKNSTYTISHKLTSAIERLTGETILLYPAVKTEAGVHAHMQTVSFKLNKEIQPETFLQALNNTLPQDIAIRDLTLEPARFHASLNLVSCTYQYIVDIAPITDVFQLKYAVHTGPGLDILSIKKAASHFIGTHNFSAFTTGKVKKNPSRTISELSLSTNEAGTKLYFTITANGFLRHMPQLIIGVLLRVGLGELSPEDVLHIFDGSLPCPPPCDSKALHLTHTSYLA